MVLKASLCLGLLAGGVLSQQTQYVQLEMYGLFNSEDDFSRPSNINLWDAGGLIGYLATVVVPEPGNSPERLLRHGNFTRIVKYAVQVLNNMSSPVVAIESEFASQVVFADGATTNYHRFGIYGDQVGCGVNKIGSDPRYPYPETFYSFSVNGACPNLANGQKDSQECLTYSFGAQGLVLGGLCPPGQAPTGSPGCVFQVVNYSQPLSIDEFVGISKMDCGGQRCTDWTDFHQNCTERSLQFEAQGIVYCAEFDFKNQPGCLANCDALPNQGCQKSEVSIPFWKDRCNETANQRRVSALISAFGGSMNDVYYTTNPSCDQYSMGGCNLLPGDGASYCQRDESGVCDTCWVPGTTWEYQDPPVPKPKGQANCRLDLFSKSPKQYPRSTPPCNANCDPANTVCSTDSDQDACCVYTQQCKPTWQVEADWDDLPCSAPCGEGTKRRRVWCPFKDIVGPCDPSDKPANSTECRGNECSWDQTHFGGFSACNNSCGAGTQTQTPVCDCPAPCTDGLNECKHSPVPMPVLPSQQCFALANSTQLDHCATCPDSGSCVTCLHGFVLDGNGNCNPSTRSVEVHFQVTAAGPLDQNPLAAAIAQGFEALLQPVVDGTVTVGDLQLMSHPQRLGAWRKLHALTSSAISIAILAVSRDSSDAGLRSARAALTNSSLPQQLTAALPSTLQGICQQLGCTVPTNLVVASTGVPEAICPDGLTWTAGKGCSHGGPASPGMSMLVIIAIVAGALLVTAGAAFAAYHFGVCRAKVRNPALAGPLNRAHQQSLQGVPAASRRSRP